jgi:hypothetical protein
VNGFILHCPVPTTDRTSGYCIALGSNVLKWALNNFHVFSRAVMTQQSKYLYEFAPYRIDLIKRALLGGRPGFSCLQNVLQRPLLRGLNRV